jgi:predicted nucleotidyltransferase
MESHHSKAIADFLALYSNKDEFVSILLVGSLAHGYAKPNSDIDIILVATEEAYQLRQKDKKLAFSLWDICTYPGGYIDCKVVSLAALKQIAEKGSDPARYAFKDAKILSCRTNSLEPLLRQVTRYPVEQKAHREHRFVCQVLAWKWYLSQAEEKEDPYLLHLSTQKLALFASRVVLNQNEALYPYHKWLLEETKKVPKKPKDFNELLESLLLTPSFETAQKLTDGLLSFVGLKERDVDWPNQFMVDSEMNWLYHEAPVDDL